MGIEQDPNYLSYSEQFHTFNLKILDFLLCTMAHFHMIFILRVEIFLSDYPVNSRIQKIFTIFNKRKRNYKLYNVDTNDEKISRIQSYLRIVEDSIEELCEIKHIFKDIHLFRESFEQASNLMEQQK